MELARWQELLSSRIRAAAPLAQPWETYRSGYGERIREALAEDFPRLLRYLGARRFDELLREFLTEPRGFQPDLGELSASFRDFVCRALPESLAPRAALLEHALKEARLAGGREPQSIGWALEPSAQLVRWRERFYLVRRSDDGLETRRLSEAAFHFLGCFARPAGLEEVLARMEKLGLTPKLVESECAAWAAEGVITPA